MFFPKWHHNNCDFAPKHRPRLLGAKQASNPVSRRLNHISFAVAFAFAGQHYAGEHEAKDTFGNLGTGPCGTRLGLGLV